MRRYGILDESSYPIASWIWGHRLREGQHWMEYLLEFLNVLYGFDYELGQGIDEDTLGRSGPRAYLKQSRLGLRRFVFYDSREKASSLFDDRAKAVLLGELQKIARENGFSGAVNTLEQTRDLLGSFSAVEQSRSWYAKSLFPVHENLLFWQGDRETGDRNPNVRFAKVTNPSEIDSLGKNGAFDRTVTLSKRNFFARGGELYYLILSAGTEQMPELRKAISCRIQELLRNRYQSVGALAGIINDSWQQVCASGEDTTGQDMSKLGWIPDPDCDFYRVVAEDVAQLVSVNLDSIDIMDLLAHLIGFHLTLYIYHRAHPDSVESVHADGSCTERCRPALLIDMMETGSDGVIRSHSAAIYREQEQLQTKAVRKYLRAKVSQWLQDCTEDDYVVHVAREAERQFKSNFQSHATQAKHSRVLEDLSNTFIRGTADKGDFIEAYASALEEIVSADFRGHFLGVHRKLTKSVGLAAPRKGAAGRFVLQSTLLKALVIANVASEGLTYDDFLDRLYRRYGLIIGRDEARTSGLADRIKIDTEYYGRNREALLTKLLHAGLAVAYSDATVRIIPG